MFIYELTILPIEVAIKAIHNEADLLIEVQKGNEKAFEEIFMGYHNQLAAYVMLLIESRELTEEIIQDVFIKIWNRRENLHQIEKFTSYLFILTRNYTLNALRKVVAERERTVNYCHLLNNEYITEPEHQEEPDFHTLIDEAVVQLPPQQKKVFVLRMQGFKNQQIASEMQISPDSVKKYQQWALRSVINYVRICTASLSLFLLFKVNLALIYQLFPEL